MKGFSRLMVALLVGAAVLCGPALASQVSEGMAIVVHDWTLFIRTAENVPLSFNPYWVQTNTGGWVPKPPAATILPALESGERVRVTWTLDEREGKRRIDNIEILSRLEGKTLGFVVSSSRTQLVIHPKDEPGTVTLNPRWVLMEGRWVPDPRVAEKLARLAPGTRVTVVWFWDVREGRKRIHDVFLGWERLEAEAAVD